MSIDLGNAPVGTPPTQDEIEQIQSVLLLGEVEDIALSTWTGSPNISSVGPITITSSQVSDFEFSVNALIPETNVSLLSSNWQTTYTTVRANSATWGGGSDDTLVSTKVRSSSANWDSSYTTVFSNSGSWGSGVLSDNNGIAEAIEVNNIVIIPLSAYNNIVSPLSTTIYFII